MINVFSSICVQDEGKTDYSAACDEVTKREISEPLATICHKVTTKRAWVTKRAGS